MTPAQETWPIYGAAAEVISLAFGFGLNQSHDGEHNVAVRYDQGYIVVEAHKNNQAFKTLRVKDDDNHSEINLIESAHGLQSVIALSNRHQIVFTTQKYGPLGLIGTPQTVTKSHAEVTQACERLLRMVAAIMPAIIPLMDTPKPLTKPLVNIEDYREKSSGVSLVNVAALIGKFGPLRKSSLG